MTYDAALLPTTIPRGSTIISRMLSAVDDSGHSARALRYVGTVLHDARDVQVPLFHVLKPMPRELLDRVVPGATLDIVAQELVGHVPVPEEKRRVRGEPLLELQTVVAVVEDRIIDIDELVRFDGELVGLESRSRRRADHFERGIPDDIGQLRREVGRPARIFAEFQAAGRGKLVTSSVYETLLPAMADHSAMTLRERQTRTTRPKENRRLVGMAHRAMKAT